MSIIGGLISQIKSEKERHRFRIWARLRRFSLCETVLGEFFQLLLPTGVTSLGQVSGDPPADGCKCNTAGPVKFSLQFQAAPMGP